MSKKLRTDEITEMLLDEILDSDAENVESDFSSGSDDNYDPKSGVQDEESSSSSSSKSELSEVESTVSMDELEEPHQQQGRLWSSPEGNFVPKHFVSDYRECNINPGIPRTSSAIEIFHKLFPRSLCMYIIQCTNERIDEFRTAKKRTNILKTDVGEIQILLGCMFVMSYNKVPALKHYWSNHPSMSNYSIKSAISRDRYKFLSSKLYFAPPQKPMDCSKTYYIDDVVECLKNTFQKYRQDSTRQSIDESMTKFKGRSSLKQYMPLKPVKRGIKMWLRCDSDTGYTYDFNIYNGREQNQCDGTLGERVVKSLVSTIRERDVTVCFDRFFTSVNLLETLEFPALGTCMRNRKNLPVLDEKLKRSESSFRVSTSGLLCVKWQDTKEVMVLSNCHTSTMTTVNKTLKDGKKISVSCPESIKFYREAMGGVDRADQMAGIYEYDRKSTKWWKKVFYRLLMFSAVNSWIIYCDLRREKLPSIEFLITLTESLIAEGKKTAAVRRSQSSGRLSKRQRQLGNVSLHLPVPIQTRRRCSKCALEKKQTRTKQICQQCNIPLCMNCFATYHTENL